MLVDVIILSNCKDKTFLDLNLRCVSSLVSSEKNFDFNILIIESNSDWNKLGFSYPFSNVNIIQPGEPFNYNRFLNIGLASTRCDLVVFANNDVIFHPAWLTEIRKIKNQFPEIQSFCPFDRTSLYLDWTKFNSKSHHLNYRVPIEFVGWCFVIERIVFRTTGIFDETFDLYFQDNDFASTLKKNRVLHAMVPSSFVQHLGGQTTRVYDASKTEKYSLDKQKYLSKWGNEPLIHRLMRKLLSLLKTVYGKVSYVIH